jgi:hypothetical protein
LMCHVISVQTVCGLAAAAENQRRRVQCG